MSGSDAENNKLTPRSPRLRVRRKYFYEPTNRHSHLRSNDEIEVLRHDWRFFYNQFPILAPQ